MVVGSLVGVGLGVRVGGVLCGRVRYGRGVLVEGLQGLGRVVQRVVRYDVRTVHGRVVHVHLGVVYV